ncbi:signal peptide peptidase SppA [Pseudogracilibacillus sp. ICA-222130]|uniref:signal peptide peptidase SppA n=1 Tax=Pseudogracilibacillus sp. ICA-222130 TaxID=3134655 RepID=UPI0030C2329F
MNKKRWIALIVVVSLFIVSIGVQLNTSLVRMSQNDLFSMDTPTYQEEIIEDGDWEERIAVLQLNGAIMEDVVSPYFGQGYSHHRMLKTIELAAEDDSIKAVLLQINSPGGAVGPTAEIHESLLALQEEYDKPFYVTMGETAASGGYYAAAPADKIYATSSTITGSIGVIMESMNYAGLAEKYGITFNTIKSGKHKDIMSPSREMTKEEKDILQSMIDEMYDEFVQVIVDGRQMTEEKVREIGDGRVYTGNQAKKVGLVDEIGTFNDALQDLRETYELENAQVIQYSQEANMFSYFVMEAKNKLQQKDSELAAVMQLIRQSDKPQAMYLY